MTGKGRHGGRRGEKRRGKRNLTIRKEENGVGRGWELAS